MVSLYWWYGDWPNRNFPPNKQPFVTITIDSISDYFKPNTITNILKPEQLVEIEGRIKEINTRNNRHTILLTGAPVASPNIICDMQPGQEKQLKLLKENDTIKVKGIFKGFLKDAVFLNCIVIYPNFHE